MATSGIISQSVYDLHSNATQITHLLSCSMNLDMETLDVTSYDSAGWKDKLAGSKSWGFSAEAYLAFDGTENIDELAADWNSATSQTVLLTNRS